VLDYTHTILFVEMKDSLSIAMRSIDVAASFELVAEIGVVVDFAIERNVQSLVFVSHRLMAGRYVDDTQSAVTQADIPVDKKTCVIRPAMSNNITHALEHADIQSRVRST
jgi:hypothetical protein